LTLETLLEEKKTFDLATQFEKLGTEDGKTGWSKICKLILLGDLIVGSGLTIFKIPKTLKS